MIKNLAPQEQPRTKAELFGIRSLSSTELLTLLLCSGYHGSDVVHTSTNLLNHAGSLLQLSKMNLHELIQVKGIGKSKALQILAAFELSRRASFASMIQTPRLDSPYTLVQWLQKEIGISQQEKILVIFLDEAMHFKHYETLFIGTINTVSISPREICKTALLHNAMNIILVHNHPSGNLTFSESDIQTTKQLVQSISLMQMKILDHIIVSANDYKSMKESGQLPSESNTMVK